MYHKILVPLDGSERAEKILPYVEALVQKFDTELVLIQVVEPVLSILAPDGMAYYDAEATTQLIEAAKAYLSGVQANLNMHHTKSKIRIESGPIVPSILQVATQENVDLIALASHGRTGLARVFYGSVAAGILNQSERALLIIRAQA